MGTIYDEGWVKLHRKIQRSSVFQNEGLLKVWIWCLVRANHEDRWIPISTGKGTTEVLVKRGQFVFGRKSAAKALGMDESTVYKRIQKLTNMENLNIQSNTHYSIVTILNYDLYQGSEKEEVTGKVTPKEHPSNTNKNYKNEKNNIGRSQKKETDPRVKEFFNYWDQIWLENIGSGYVHSYGMEGKSLKALLKVYDLIQLKEAARSYFANERCQQRGLDFKGFFYEMNRRTSLKAMNPLEQAKRELER